MSGNDGGEKADGAFIRFPIGHLCGFVRLWWELTIKALKLAKVNLQNWIKQPRNSRKVAQRKWMWRWRRTSTKVNLMKLRSWKWVRKSETEMQINLCDDRRLRRRIGIALGCSSCRRNKICGVVVETWMWEDDLGNEGKLSWLDGSDEAGNLSDDGNRYVKWRGSRWEGSSREDYLPFGNLSIVVSDLGCCFNVELRSRTS